MFACLDGEDWKGSSRAPSTKLLLSARQVGNLSSLGDCLLIVLIVARAARTTIDATGVGLNRDSSLSIIDYKVVQTNLSNGHAAI